MDSSNLWRLYEEQSFVDCTIEGGRYSWKCHKVVVSAASPFLEAEFLNSSSDTIKLPYIDKVSESFGELLPFLYDSEAERDIQLKYTLRLMVLSGLLGVRKVRDKVYNKIMQFTNKGPMESCAIATLLSDTWIRPRLRVLSPHQESINIANIITDLSMCCRLISDNCISIMTPFASAGKEAIQPEVLMSMFQDNTVSRATMAKMIVAYVSNKDPSSLPSDIFTQVRLQMNPSGNSKSTNQCTDKEIESDEIFQSTGCSGSASTGPAAPVVDPPPDSVVKIKLDLAKAIEDLNGRIDDMKSQVASMESTLSDRINHLPDSELIIDIDREDSPELLDAQVSAPLPLIPSTKSIKSRYPQIDKLLADIAEDTQSSIASSKKRFKQSLDD
eukprot:TRINITY_DN34402_c0_g1_i1.p1 TRINITY_DN34402_c0_g1~~TRINITY_DN34402_c0_g1_i1.p1  ORF type:complete len:386 (+),score=64.93 TRINITY_DN34402_c0_g1_i1:106-1263(+)